MLLPGLVSITFRKLSPAAVIALVKKAGLRGIEWGGDVHVPPGDLSTARVVRELTEEAGLRVAAYGSYYRVGKSEADGLPFERVLETGLELGAPTIRVWAGTAGSAAVDEEGRWRIIAELKRICDLAAKKGVTVSLEFHAGTLTDTNESASRLLLEVDHANLLTLWQPPNGMDTFEAMEGLEGLLSQVGNVHVFHWWPTSADRRVLGDGEERWRMFFGLLEQAPGDRYVMLEFVPGDSEEAFVRDAATLRRWVGGEWADQG